MISRSTLIFICVLVATMSGSMGYSVGVVFGVKTVRDSLPQERKPVPPSTICTMKMPSSKYKQLDCVRHAWRAQ